MSIAIFQSRLTRLDYLNMHILVVPAFIKTQHSISNKERFIVSINDSVNFQGGLMNYQNGDSYIMLNAKNIKKLNLKEGDVMEVTLERDTSQYGLPMPEELQAILDSDEEANIRFQKLRDGKKRNIINFINIVKSPELRVNRGLQIMDNLKSLPEGKEYVRYLLYGR